MISQKASGTVRNSLKWKDPLIVFKHHKNFMDIKLNNLGSWYNTVFCRQLIFYFGIFILCLGVNKHVGGVHFFETLEKLVCPQSCVYGPWWIKSSWGSRNGVWAGVLSFSYYILSQLLARELEQALSASTWKGAPLPLPLSLRTFTVNLFSSPVV